jgi:hypothetical protein
MNSKELEELIYEYGHVMYRLGRMETDGNSSTKEYNKMDTQKEDIKKKFNGYFANSKLAKTLNVIQ